MTKVSKFGIFILFISLICSAHCLKDGMNAKPPMGWTSRAVGCGINESLIENIGDRLITSGLAGKGYQYVRVNDCWQGSRDQVSSRITSNARKFPSGIKALVGSMKNKGLKLGLGSDIGPTTCANQPGSYNF
jgi:alpha-galactosidase